MRLEPIEERVVVLVGASSGIGRKAAADCADMGARVAAAALARGGDPGQGRQGHRRRR